MSFLLSGLSLGLLWHSPSYGAYSRSSALLHNISNAPQTVISLQMQQIHSFNFKVDPLIWQLANIRTFEDKDRYEFSKNFKCVAQKCTPQTTLSMTLVTYKYGPKIYTKNEFEKKFPLSKWQHIFEKGAGITARFKKTISLPAQTRQTSPGFRYHQLKIGDKKMNGQVDMLYYGQSQVRFIISSPTTKQSLLEKFLQKIEQTMSLQLLR